MVWLSLGNPVFSLSGTEVSTCKTVKYPSGFFLSTHFILLQFCILTLLSPQVGVRETLSYGPRCHVIKMETTVPTNFLDNLQDALD